MYKYETHLHTAPVSRCASASVEDTVAFYKEKGYDGIFITNHFINGNINVQGNKSYEEVLNYYFSDYEKGVALGERLGIKVFMGIETTYGGTDFLVYGLDKKWYFEHPEIMDMRMSEMLEFMKESGALVVQAHPFREASYIDHIRLFPRNIHGVEVANACRTDFENAMAKLYAERYELLEFAGSDNHVGANAEKLAGMCADEPILNERDFVERVKRREMQTFYETKV